MEWARSYYTKQSRTFATGKITDAHLSIAERLHGWCADMDGCRRVLELGAGMGGTAALLAERGYDVCAVEINASDAAFARDLADADHAGSLTVIEDDFYTVTLDGTFDFVFYWDGFGIGDDNDQRRLLRRIATEWLAPGGRALLDVYSPWNWLERDGERSVYTARDGGQWERRVEYDRSTSRFIDHWEPLPDRDEHRTQTLRCYTLPEFSQLVDGTGLRVRSVIGMDGRTIDVQGGDGSADPYLRETNGFFALLDRGSSPDG